MLCVLAVPPFIYIGWRGGEAAKGAPQEGGIRGGNGSDADRIVLLPFPFSYFENEYESEYGCYRIWMRLGYYSNTDTYRIFS